MGLVNSFDSAVDRYFDEHLRDRTSVDRLMYAASALGDHGILWLLIASARQGQRLHRGERSWRPFVRAAAGVGIESALVNGPVKWIFRRERPIVDTPRTRHLRQPRTSSFPSGHATSAFCAAALLRDDDPLWPLYYAAAIVVATSRVHVRIHHASDVAGGIVLGIALGELARWLVPLSPAQSTPGTDTTESSGKRRR